MPPAWPWPHFSQAELQCRHCGQCRMPPAFLDRLERLRGVFGLPLVVSSGYRCPAHNAAVSTTGPHGPHTTGRAVDLLVHGADALDLLDAALRLGFVGIGVQQKGPHAGRFLHLDDLQDAPGQPRATMWSY